MCVPPVWIVKPTTKDLLLPQSFYESLEDTELLIPQPNGKMDSDCFLKWIKHFHVHIGGNTRKRVVLLSLDSGPGHVSYDVLLFALNHRIIIIFLPTHTTHLWMVIDTHFNKPFHAVYDTMIVQWLAEQRPLCEEVYFHISRIAYYDVYGVAAAQAFSELGLFPPNLEKLKQQIVEKYNELPPTQEKGSGTLTFRSEKAQALFDRLFATPQQDVARRKNDETLIDTLTRWYKWQVIATYDLLRSGRHVK